VSMSRFLLFTLLSIQLGSGISFGQRGAHAASRGGPLLGAPTGNAVAPPVYSYFYPTSGWYGGYFSPFLPTAQTYLPNYWWTGPYPPADPRQDGYNPDSGYPWETVTTLLLSTFPAKARVILDGVFVGTADRLGPTQLPPGEHTLRVDATFYEPSEIVLKVEQPTLQELEVRLKPIVHAAKPGPHQ